MRFLVLLSLVTLSQCAPVMEQKDDTSFGQVGADEEKVERMKRAQEVIMYGNEQNVQKVVKKSDPNIDLKGHIDASEPVDVANESPETGETVGSEEQVNTEINAEDAKTTEEDSVEQSVESDEQVDDLAEQLLKQEEPEIEESLISSDVTPPELDESAPASGEATSVETDAVSLENSVESGKGSDEDMNSEALQQYLDELYMRQLQQELQNYYNRYNDNFGPAYRRRRSYRLRRKARSRRPYVSQDKLNHRSKRDLIYPSFEDDESLGDVSPYADQYLDDGYPEEEPEIEYLQDYLDFLDNVRAQEEAERLRSAYNADLEPITSYQGEPGYFVPKRQAGLNFVPGLKRDDIFFPAYEEPRSHWGAFVPSKRDYRDYAEKYERLMQLAAILSGREDVEVPYDEQEYDWDRK